MTEQIFIQGYASIFDEVDANGDCTIKGCFKKDLKAWSYRPMLFAHDQDRIIGRWLSMKEDKIGLFIEGLVTDEQIIQQVSTKALLGLSIGYITLAMNKNNWIRNLTQIELKEVSITPVSMNRGAMITYCGAWEGDKK